MMIETKGTKSGAGPEDGRERYAWKGADAKSGAPYYLALAVAALAAYLKSMFLTPAHAEAEAEGASPPQGGGPRLVVVAASEKEPDDGQPEGRLPGSSGSAAQLEAPASEYDSPQYMRGHALHFAKPDPQPNLNDFKASPVIPRPTNDNAGASSGGGHGGGGGGGRSRDGGETETHPRPGQDGTSTGHDAGHTDVVGPEQPGKVQPGGGTDDQDGRRNRAPVSSGPVLLANTTGCALLAIAMTDLLRNVQDPDGDTLSVQNVSVSSGSLSRAGDGWVFDGDGIGPVTITYEVTDGALSVTQTASFNVVERNHLTGTAGDDVILGTPCSDEIDAGNGDDNVDARGGADVIDGGAGNDHILAGDGDDTVLGGLGDDVIFAGAGADVVSGGTGDDRIFGEAGDDTLFGDAGDDLLDGGEGDDILVGGTGNDLLSGDVGDDRIDGGEGNDRLFGGLGRDVLIGGDGDDRMEAGDGDDVLSDGAGRDVAMGEDGNDVLVAALDGEADLLDGGAGEDTLDLSATVSGVDVDLMAGTASGVETGHDSLVSIEAVRGGSGDDVIVGGSGSDELSGGEGRDRLSGGAGNDHLDGGAGDDVLLDGAGADHVVGGAGNDMVTAASDGEADSFDGGVGWDTLDLSATDDGIVVDLAAGTLDGSETGHDLVSGMEAVLGGTGDDVLTGGNGDDTLLGGDGDDHISGGAGDDLLAGGDGRDAIIDGAGRDIVRSGAGDDRIALSRDGQDDIVDGGEGFDTLDLTGATGNLIVDLVSHVVSGSDLGTDRIESIEGIVGGSGHDRFLVGGGDAVLTGGGGDDGYVFSSGHGPSEGTRAVEITDFSVGDYVDLLRWTLFEDASDAPGQSLSDAMERNDGTVSGIQYRSAHLDDGDVTVISADLNGDDTFETTIILDGHHTLLFVETPATTSVAAVVPVA
ncbi:cadherin-like domain-containing protein [Methylobacterium goesingense]|uniref:Ca2+-binding RTX toxin-like protein n=1 Tax=Methylobacterium goesingense TaxID=243690 RepID=A0ABV2L2I3_9HYPH|nr:cadherin-like domain-containing protein [Methylobacterium goesingense]GJD74015.1 hypothetical protein CFIICLFH_2248 [Methylobacterium goesingense]